MNASIDFSRYFVNSCHLKFTLVLYVKRPQVKKKNSSSQITLLSPKWLSHTWVTDDEKKITIYSLRFLGKEKNPDMYAFVRRSWGGGGLWKISNLLNSHSKILKIGLEPTGKTKLSIGPAPWKKFWIRACFQYSKSTRGCRILSQLGKVGGLILFSGGCVGEVLFWIPFLSVTFLWEHN